jgi:hypothetical protein
LGGSAAEIFDIRNHSFPGFRTPQKAWPTQEGRAPLPTLNSVLSELVASGELDACGAMQIAGQNVGVPSTAVAAAAIQIGQACRAIASSEYCDLVDVSLANPSRASAHQTRLERGGVLRPQRRRRSNMREAIQ